MRCLINVTTCYVCNSPITLIGEVPLEMPNPTNVYKCKECKHVSITPFPTSNYLESLYDTKSQLVLGVDFVEANEKFPSTSTVVNPGTWVSDLVQSYPKGDLLDFGCADVASFRRGANFYSHLDEVSEPAKFDYVVLQDVLEHLVDPKILIQEIVQRTKKNGIWFISIPTSSSLEFRTLKQNWDMISPYAHLHFYSHESINKVLNEAGLRILNIKKRRKPTNWNREIKNFSRLCLSIPYSMIRMKGMSHLQCRWRALVHSIVFICSLGDQLEIIAQKK